MKKQTLNEEFTRIQLLAGIITENKLNEEDKAAEEEKIQNSVEKAINSPQSQSTLQKMADQLSDEDKQRIMKFMSSINESASGVREPDLEDVTKKLMSLAENNKPQYQPDRSDAKHLLGQVIYGAPVTAMGVGLIKGILAGGAAVGLAAATPFFIAAAAGAVLIGLYKIIKTVSSNKEKPTSNKVSGLNNLNNLNNQNRINEAKRWHKLTNILTETIEVPTWLKDKSEDVHIYNRNNKMKKQTLNEEFTRMQLLAGVITESEYNQKKKLIENQVTNNPVVQKLEKKAFDFINQPQVAALIKKEIDKLSPEKKAELAKTVMQEGDSNDFSSFKATVDKVMNDVSLTEDMHDFLRQKVGGYKEGEAPNDLDYAVGKILKTTGTVNIMSMGFLPLITSMALDHFGGTDIINTISQAIGSGGLAAGLSVLAGLIGGGILWKIGDILTDERSENIIE